MNKGFTLLECVIVLAIMGIGIALGLPALQRQRDRWSVTHAREASAAILARARVEALGAGGSSVTVFPSQARIERGSAGTVQERLELGRLYGVSIRTTGQDTAVAIEFNALGLGRMAARTLRFERGRASSSLVVSAYGRVSRR